ncbi:unnamed protein product, partial [Symbiodinium microadriaticum]
IGTTRVAGILGALGLVFGTLGLVMTWGAESSTESPTQPSAAGEESLDLSELMELFRSLKAHPLGAKALADANASFGLTRDRLGRRIWEDLPVPTLSDAADPRSLQVSLWKLPEPRILSEDVVETASKSRPRPPDAPLLRELAQMLDPEGRPVPPTSDIFSPESVRAFDTTTCFFDVYQTMQYIAYAGLMIYYCTIAANDVDFAADITGVQASVAWVASYLASAFSTCIGGLVAGDCVSNVAWTAGNFPQLASDALSIVGDCNSDNETERFEMPRFRRRRDGILSLVNGTRLDEIRAILKKLRQRRHRPNILQRFRLKEKLFTGRQLRTRGAPGNAQLEAAQASCFFDSQAMISFFARFGLQVVTEMKDCAVVDTETAKMECAWGIIYAFDNFGWAVEYILQSINDCKEEGNVDVLCAEAIGDIVFSGTGMMPSVAWAYRDCRQRFRS